MTASLRTDLPPDAYHDTPWTLALPWLGSHPAGSLPELSELAPAPDWWLTESPAVTSMAAPHDEICATLSRVILGNYPEVPFRDLLPTLPARLPLAALPLGSRSRTTLQRLDAHIVRDLSTRSIRDLFDVRGTGQGTVEEITAALIGAAITRPLTPDTHADHDDPDTPAMPAPQLVLPPVHQQLLDDLTHLARWRHIRGAATEPLITVQIEEGTPEELQDLVHRLNAVTATDIAPILTELDPVADIAKVISQLNERQVLILRERFLATAPKTLDELATRTGVSRERVRQIEAAVRDLLLRTFHYGTPVGDMMASLRVEIQPVAALDRLIARHPDLARTVPHVDVPLWLVLDRLDDYFEVIDGWAATPDIPAARERTRALLDDYADEHGIVDPTTLAHATVGLPGDEMRRWLQWCGYPYHKGKVLTRTRSTGDHAAALLAISGTPLTAEQLLEQMATDRNLRTVANALAEDDRFVRTDRAKWGLSTWDVDTYTGIREEIRRLVTARGNAVPLVDLVESITGRFSVSPLSIQAYASGDDFETVDGTVRLRETRTAPRKEPADTRRLYRQGDTWRLRIEVTVDHLRGSGFSLPVAVAGVVGCTQGEAVELESRLGRHPVRWTRLQPSSGTIKRFLDAINAVEGQTIFLEFMQGGHFDVRPLHAAAGQLDPLQHAVALTGCIPPATEADQIAVLAQAVELPAAAKPRHILSAYGRRGDDDIVALLETTWTRPRGIEEAPEAASTAGTEQYATGTQGQPDDETMRVSAGPSGGETSSWVPVPDGYRSVGWIRPIEAQAAIEAYEAAADVPVKTAGQVTGWARYRDTLTTQNQVHNAKVELTRTRSDGERSICWLLHQEALAILQADRRGRTTPVGEVGGSWTGLVEYFESGSSEAQRFRSPTRLLRRKGNAGP